MKVACCHNPFPPIWVSFLGQSHGEDRKAGLGAWSELELARILSKFATRLSWELENIQQVRFTIFIAEISVSREFCDLVVIMSAA